MNSELDARQYNTRLGLILFVIYLVIYLGFVILSAFASGVMETRVLAGLNLAIVYGFALIIGAFVMAMIYGFMCRVEPLVTQDVPEELKAGAQLAANDSDPSDASTDKEA